MHGKSRACHARPRAGPLPSVRGPTCNPMEHAWCTRLQTEDMRHMNTLCHTYCNELQSGARPRLSPIEEVRSKLVHVDVVRGGKGRCVERQAASGSVAGCPSERVRVSARDSGPYARKPRSCPFCLASLMSDERSVFGVSLTNSSKSITSSPLRSPRPII